LKKFSLGPKTPRKHSIEKTATVFFSEEANNIEEKRKKQRENKAKSTEIERANSPNFSGLQVRNCRKKKSIKTDIHYQETAKILKTML